MKTWTRTRTSSLNPFINLLEIFYAAVGNIDFKFIRIGSNLKLALAEIELMKAIALRNSEGAKAS